MARTVTHIDLGRRKALKVRLDALLALPPDLGTDDRSLRKRDDIVEQLWRIGDGLWDDPGPLDETIQKLSETLPRLGAQWAGTPLAEAVEALRRKWSCFKCSDCARATCTGHPDFDHANVAAKGECLRSIKDLLEAARHLCREMYLAFSDADAARIEENHTVELETSWVSEDNDTGLLGKFHVSGRHVVNGPLASIVGLEFRDRHFNHEAAQALFYTLVHELVCHAYQAVGAETREDCLTTCPWSEGWMDAFARELVDHWLDEQPQRLPEWIVRDSQAVKRVSGAIHYGRYEPTRTLSGREHGRRTKATEIYSGLKQRWSRRTAMIKLPQSQMAAFSVAVNGAAMSRNDRKMLALDLIVLLGQPEASAARQAAAGLCSRLALRDIGFDSFKTKIDSLVSEGLAA